MEIISFFFSHWSKYWKCVQQFLLIFLLHNNVSLWLCMVSAVILKPQTLKETVQSYRYRLDQWNVWFGNSIQTSLKKGCHSSQDACLTLLGSRKKERVVGENIPVSKQQENIFHFLFSSGLTGKISLCVSVYHFTRSLEIVLLVACHLPRPQCRNSSCLSDQLPFIFKPMELLLHIG